MTIKDYMEQNPNQIPTGFVSPEGKFYYASFLEHCAMADEICEWYGYKTGGYGYNSPGKDPLTTLEDKGWIHITVSSFFEHGINILFTAFAFTEEQKNCLRPLIENPPIPFTKSSIHTLKYEFPDIDFGGYLAQPGA